MMSYFIYMLECCDGSLYTGITTDVIKRLDEHNSSTKGAKYTKARRPVKLVYEEASNDRSSASKREYAIKKLTRIKKLQLINEPSKKEGH
ncbi:GIY-YIG nuclease family protein [Arcobacter sp. KX21116]